MLPPSSHRATTRAIRPAYSPQRVDFDVQNSHCATAPSQRSGPCTSGTCTPCSRQCCWAWLPRSAPVCWPALWPLCRRSSTVCSSPQRERFDPSKVCRGLIRPTQSPQRVHRSTIFRNRTAPQQEHTLERHVPPLCASLRSRNAHEHLTSKAGERDD